MKIKLLKRLRTKAKKYYGVRELEPGVYAVVTPHIAEINYQKNRQNKEAAIMLCIERRREFILNHILSRRPNVF